MRFLFVWWCWVSLPYTLIWASISFFLCAWFDSYGSCVESLIFLCLPVYISYLFWWYWVSVFCSLAWIVIFIPLLVIGDLFSCLSVLIPLVVCWYVGVLIGGWVLWGILMCLWYSNLVNTSKFWYWHDMIDWIPFGYFLCDEVFVLYQSSLVSFVF